MRAGGCFGRNIRILALGELILNYVLFFQGELLPFQAWKTKEHWAGVVHFGVINGYMVFKVFRLTFE